MGSFCNIPATAMAQYSSFAFSVPTTVFVDFSLPAFAVSDPEAGYLFTGNRPVSVFSLTNPPQQVALLDFGGTVISLYSSGTILHAFVVDLSGSVVHRYVKHGNFSFIAVAGNQTNNGQSAPQRGASRSFVGQSLAQATVRHVVGSLSQLLVVLSSTDQPATVLEVSTSLQVVALIDVTQSFNMINADLLVVLQEGTEWVMVLVGGQSIQLACWQAVVVNVTVEGFVHYVANESGASVEADPLGFCTPRSRCKRLRSCISLETSTACVAETRSGPIVIRITLPLVIGQRSKVTLGPTLLASDPEFNVTAMALDKYSRVTSVIIALSVPSPSSSPVYVVSAATLAPFALQTPADSGVEGPLIVSALFVNETMRSVTCVVFANLPTAVHLYTMNLFGLVGTTPNVIDADGAFSVVFNGFGFPSDEWWNPVCVFGEYGRGNVTAATVFNSSIVRCDAPPQSLADQCAAIPVTVMFAARSAASPVLPVTVLRPSSAILLSASSSSGNGRALINRRQSITITGRGFVASTFATCRGVMNLENGTSHIFMLEQVQSGMSPDTVVATLPALAAEAIAVLQYSHDGMHYGPSSTPLAIVGRPAALAMFPPVQQAEAAIHQLLPSVEVLVVDRLGSPLLSTLVFHHRAACISNQRKLHLSWLCHCARDEWRSSLRKVISRLPQCWKSCR